MPEQIVLVPEIVPGVDGTAELTIIIKFELEVPQAFATLTVTMPLVELEVVVKLFVVEAPDQLLGLTHIYEVTATFGTEYVLVLPTQTFDGPDIAPGEAGLLVNIPLAFMR